MKKIIETIVKMSMKSKKQLRKELEELCERNARMSKRSNVGQPTN